MKNIFKYILIISILIIIYLIALCVVSLIPSEKMELNVKQSSETLNEQTNNFFIWSILKNKYIKFDNYTDALMINTAYSIDYKHPFESCLLCRKNYIPGITQKVYTDTVYELKSASKYEEIDQVAELNDTVNKDIIESFEYARYWHGYLVPLRILLCFFNITGIRILYTIILVILFGVLLYFIYKKLGSIIMVIFGVALICIEYLYIGFSLQGSSVFFIMMISSIYLLYNYKKIKDYNKFFLIIGSITCFFDFLTVPLITLGVPFAILFLLKQKEERDFVLKEIILLILKIIISWSVGYTITFVLKWIITDLVLNKTVMQTSR